MYYNFQLPKESDPSYKELFQQLDTIIDCSLVVQALSCKSKVMGLIPFLIFLLQGFSKQPTNQFVWLVSNLIHKFFPFFLCFSFCKGKSFFFSILFCYTRKTNFFFKWINKKHNFFSWYIDKISFFWINLKILFFVFFFWNTNKFS